MQKLKNAKNIVNRPSKRPKRPEKILGDQEKHKQDPCKREKNLEGNQKNPAKTKS